jgi:phage gpG-like protein
MSKYKSISDFERALKSVVRQKIPPIIAETATEYFKERFAKKEWEGKPWPATSQVVRRGSLLVRSSKLVNSIRPTRVNQSSVRIGAGNSRVPYAQIHNEGGVLTPEVTPAMRKWAWAMHRKEGGRGTGMYKGLALTRKKRLRIVIPQRQFMGASERLNAKIMQRILAVINEK